MGFEKGASGNAKGRPKGSVSKTTKKAREWLFTILAMCVGNVTAPMVEAGFL